MPDIAEDKLLDLVEEKLGVPIFAAEFRRAKEIAVNKLSRIIEREGDAGGQRRSLEYLACLVSEAVHEKRCSEFTMSELLSSRNRNKKMLPPDGEQHKDNNIAVPIIAHS